MTEPVPPRNVRMITGDGEVVPIDLVYAGIDDHGLHVWESVRPIDFHPESGDHFDADLIPAQTTIRLEAVGS